LGRRIVYADYIIWIYMLKPFYMPGKIHEEQGQKDDAKELINSSNSGRMLILVLLR
jgi:hypothetical protein